MSDTIKAKDYVKLKDGAIWKVASVNVFRPPECKYALETTNGDDLMFIGYDKIEKEECERLRQEYEEEYGISLQKYEDDLLKGVDNLKRALKYYMERTRNLENENKLLNKMYENRVNEYLKKENNNDNHI